MNEKKQDPLTKMPVFPHFGDLSVPKISIRLLKKKKNHTFYLRCLDSSDGLQFKGAKSLISVKIMALMKG